MVPQQAASSTNNNVLAFIVAALFMITLTFMAIFYVETGSSFSTIKQNQQHNSQTSVTRQQDLTQITCSMWHTMTTSPNVHPSPDVQRQMTSLCD
jgi:hypothetical protein